MKTVILCGGRGTRLGEHGENVPKALIPIGGYPIIWHLLKTYSSHGINSFVLCLGFLGEQIERYLSECAEVRSGEWNIQFVETGLDTNTGGRLFRVRDHLKDDETFCVTYGDGLSDVNISKSIEFYRQTGCIGMLTAVHPLSPFGVVNISPGSRVTSFQEKPVMRDWINGGYFVFNHSIFGYLSENCILEREPLERLAESGELAAYQHDGFWKCMDTYKDNIEFNQLWNEGHARWKVW
jgi:glucose-1-phosphate cytidylyltransferase